MFGVHLVLVVARGVVSFVISGMVCIKFSADACFFTGCLI